MLFVYEMVLVNEDDDEYIILLYKASYKAVSHSCVL